MRITFLGHQGWRFENGGRSFLLDPILEDIGNGAVGMPVWPRRRLDFGKLGPLDAVIVSHEHADHFSLATLAALPQGCRIYLSDLSSFAMAKAIAELGFQVTRFAALEPFTICGLELTALPGLYNTLEPDTYALLVRDAAGGSFLTGIDTVAHPDVLAWLARNCPERTLDNLTNNFVEARQALVDDPAAFAKSRAAVAGNMLEFVQKFRPRRAVVSGQGWCFQGAKAKLNHSFFSVDNRWLAAAARDLAPHVEWLEGAPGLRLTLTGPELAVDRAPEIDVLDSPDRTFDPASVRGPDPFLPWSGVRSVPADRLRRIRDFIVEDFGRILGAHAPNLMQRLYYSKFQGAGTFGVCVRNASARHLFELDYGHLTFAEAQASAPDRCAVGLEIWAGDLELLIAAEEDAFAVMESAVRTWTRVPELVDTQALLESFLWFTPRFRPNEFLRFYRSRIRGLRAQPPQARHA
ncbi:MAG TPA: MBL fold metallo-hydrolase [Gammaproteobacteria bacterium]|nr:MBL fold metallo-hydrolase [Gammaproteobacteria bacterium]